MANQWVSIFETKDASPGLGFIARAIRVDNLTASWLYCVDGNYYIPPYYYGVVFAITGTDAPTFAWKTPGGIIPNPPGNGIARVEAFDSSQAASSGMLVYNQSQIAQVVGTYQTSNGAYVNSPSFQLPAGTQSIVVMYPFNKQVPDSSRLAIVGEQSGVIIGFSPFPQNPGFLTAIIGVTTTSLAWSVDFPSGGVDTSFHIQHLDTGATIGTVQVYAIFVPLPIAVTAELDVSAPIIVNPAPLPNNNLNTRAFTASLAAAATKLIIAGVAAQRITVYSLEFTLESATGVGLRGQFQDSAGHAIARGGITLGGVASGLQSQFQHGPQIPVQLSTAADFDFVADAANAGNIFIDGVVCFTQL